MSYALQVTLEGQMPEPLQRVIAERQQDIARTLELRHQPERQAMLHRQRRHRVMARFGRIAACAAIAAGCEFGMLMVPVPSTICLVWCATLARNIMQEVTFSARSVTCSPTSASLYPSRSASRIASRSSA